MSELKEKAKSAYDIRNHVANIITKYASEHLDATKKEADAFTDVVYGKKQWVRLEDAEQALLNRLIPLEQEVSILQKERLELKQKLQKLLKEFPKEMDSKNYERGCNASFLMYSYAGVQMWLKKAGELLLKEEKANGGKS